MKTLCDHIDGTTTFICMMTTALIHYSLLSNDVSVMSKDYKLLEPYTDSPMIKKTTIEDRVETSCLILSILSSLIIKRPDDLLYHSSFFLTLSHIHQLHLLVNTWIKLLLNVWTCYWRWKTVLYFQQFWLVNNTFFFSNCQNANNFAYQLVLRSFIHKVWTRRAVSGGSILRYKLYRWIRKWKRRDIFSSNLLYGGHCWWRWSSRKTCSICWTIFWENDKVC